MPKVSRSRWLPYPPAYLYQVLTEVQNLPHITKRIETIEVIEQISATEAHTQVRLDLPMGQHLVSQGYVRGVPDQQLSFRTEQPIPLEFSWNLNPAEQDNIAGTEIVSSLEIELGMAAAVVSNFMLQGILAAELDADLERLASWLASQQQ